MKIVELKQDKAKGLIKTCAKLSGITQDLASDDYLVIGLMLKEEFGHLKSNYIKDAFLKYASGKLTYNTDKGQRIDIKHYNSFTPDFVGEVLQSYKKYRSKQNTIKKIGVERQIEERKETPEERQKRAFEFIKECIEKNEEIYSANWSDAFLYAEKEGYINLSNEEKRDYAKKVQNDVTNQIASERKKSRPLSQYLNLLSTPTGIKIECRRRLLIEYLKK